MQETIFLQFYSRRKNTIYMPVLPRHNDLEYRTFMRAAAAETDALQDAVAACDGGPPDLILGLGIEFPTQRMLQYMNKGFGPDDIIRALSVCRHAEPEGRGPFGTVCRAQTVQARRVGCGLRPVERHGCG